MAFAGHVEWKSCGTRRANSGPGNARCRKHSFSDRIFPRRMERSKEKGDTACSHHARLLPHVLARDHVQQGEGLQGAMRAMQGLVTDTEGHFGKRGRGDLRE